IDPRLFGGRPVATICDVSMMAGFGCSNLQKLNATAPTRAVKALAVSQRKGLRLSLAEDTQDTLPVVRPRTTYPARLPICPCGTRRRLAHYLTGDDER
ncbi:hypothetical protein, partial [[Eubacterium] cellulosolvens]